MCAPAPEAPVARQLPTARQLQHFADARRYAEAAALLEGLDLDGVHDAEFCYFAGVCLGWAGQHDRAIALLKRAADGYDAYWCACHLGFFENNRGNPVSAAHYLTVALLLQPAETQLHGLLREVAPGIELTALEADKGGARSAAAARAAVARATAQRAHGNVGAAAYYLTIALALDPSQPGTRASLLDLVPDLAPVLPSDTSTALIAGLRNQLAGPVQGDADLERRLTLIADAQRDSREWYASGRSLIPDIERVLECALASGEVTLDRLCMLYDVLYWLYWMTSPNGEAMRGFGASVVAPVAAAVRGGSIGGALPAARLRPLGREPLRLGYLVQYAQRGRGTMSRLIPHLLGGLSHYAPERYRMILYAWMGYDDRLRAPLESDGVVVRRLDDGPLSERVSRIAAAVAEDEIDILITDMNSSLPTVLFERRVAPVQIFYQLGMPSWPIDNLDAAFCADPAEEIAPFVGIDVGHCFTLGMGPWDLATLTPAVDPARVAAERARFPAGVRLIGTYGRLVKITPDFLEVVAALLARHPDLVVLLGGTGEGGWIRDFIAERRLSGRIELTDHYVDGHLWGHLLEIFLDTFPHQGGGISCREVLAKGRPVVVMNLQGIVDPKDCVPSLIASDHREYIEIVSRLLDDAQFYQASCQAARDFAAAQASTADYAAAVDRALTVIVERVRQQTEAEPRRAEASA